MLYVFFMELTAVHSHPLTVGDSNITVTLIETVHFKILKSRQNKNYITYGFSYIKDKILSFYNS